MRFDICFRRSQFSRAKQCLKASGGGPCANPLPVMNEFQGAFRVSGQILPEFLLRPNRFRFLRSAPILFRSTYT
jgi:hypothetical protein